MKARTLLLLLLLALFLAACGGDMPGAEPSPTEELPAAGEEEEPATTAPPPTTVAVTPIATQEGALATPAALEHMAEVEWPPRMRLGESDVVRLSLLPSEEGYVVTTEFPEHRIVTETLALEQRAGYEMLAVARLDGVGFDLSPQGEQPQDWQPDWPLTWRWIVSPRSTGQQRLSVNLAIQWRPEPGRSLPSRQVNAFSRGLDVQVVSLLGLTTGQAMMMGIVGLLLGLTLTVPLMTRGRARKQPLRRVRPDRGLQLEPHPSLTLDEPERTLLQALFRRYDRAAVEREFHSGYSGARTFLVLPIRPDGGSDAYTIAKMGDPETILREYDNYETYVEHTLPPVTARIQGRPVMAEGRTRGSNGAGSLAALRYTFIGSPGQQPVSLRQALQDGAGPELLETLFQTFGPNWWMQRRPYTFRLAQEYDCKLPAHYYLEPAKSNGPTLDGRASPFEDGFGVGETITLRHFTVVERKNGGQQLALQGEAAAGHPPLRLRWLGSEMPSAASGRIVATRQSLLQGWTASFERYGLPDPLASLPAILSQTLSGTRSIVHGDLNLENILVGPGDFVWLIDFARTGQGHTLFDFAHLGAEIVAHLLPSRLVTPDALLAALAQNSEPLLAKVEEIACRCLFDPRQPREYWLALYLSCLGALKHNNLDDRARHYLYLTAAHLTRQLS